jgi:hypothetical protein
MTVSVSPGPQTPTPSMPVGAVPIIVTNNVSGNTNVTMYTVTAGKTLYIVAAGLSVVSSGASAVAAKAAIDVGVGGTTVEICWCTTAQAAAGQDASSANISFPTPVPVAATKNVRLYANHAQQTAYGSFVGYEM